MILSRVLALISRTCIPRESGDDPFGFPQEIFPEEYSPRERG